eukprot:scaffold2436_cov132-Skeletonema_marinoi.AAC.3
MKSAAVFSLFIWSICFSCLSAFTPSLSSHKSKSFIALHNKFSIRNHASNQQQQQHSRISPKLFTATNNNNENNNDDVVASSGVRNRMRKSVTSAKERVKRLLPGLSEVEDNVVQFTKKGGQPIAEVLADAAMNAAEMAAEEVRSTALSVILRSPSSGSSGRGKTLNLETQAQIEADALVAMDSISLAKTSVADAFDAAEMALSEVEEDIARARRELEAAKRDATLGLAETNEQSEKASVAVSDAEPSLEATIETETEVTTTEEETIENEDIPDESQSDFDVSTLKYEDVDYTLTDMAPPFINEDECLVPGEPVVRVEKAPQNSRRIFAGIDIPVSVDDVWKLLTDYPNLQKVVPNLVVNEVLELYSGGEGEISVDTSLSDENQCKAIANHMKGAVLKQVGGAKVVGINFSARTTLEVREWPSGMPDFAHYEDEIYQGKSRGERVRESKGRELTRYVFPRPFALSSLPHKDISMQSIEKDDGEFRMYQGVWRMQPLPGCSPPGESAMRLTYAVEVSPRPYLPVALVEGRIAQDLCANLKAIREIMTR